MLLNIHGELRCRMLVFESGAHCHRRNSYSIIVRIRLGLSCDACGRQLYVRFCKLWISYVQSNVFRVILTRAERILQMKDTSQSIKRLPHVTWCPTGPLTRLPLHAAGIYDLHVPTDSRPRVYDYVVSSYTPSLTALMRSLQSANARLVNPKVLIVTQPATPGYSSLSGTHDERRRLETVLPESQRTLLDDKDATVQRTLSAMCEHPWIHLACHGFQKPENPIVSTFALYDKPPTEPPSLSALTGTESTNAELVFLSAYQTAVGDETALAVGFRGVTGTMWSIWADDAPTVVEASYVDLLKLRKSGDVAKGTQARRTRCTTRRKC